MVLTSLHDFDGSWHLYICRSLFSYSTFLLLHSCLWRALLAVLQGGIFSRVEPFDRAMANVYLEVIDSAVICMLLRGFWHLGKHVGHRLKLFGSTELISYLPSHVFLQRRRNLTSRKLYACLVKLYCFFQPSDQAYVSRVWCIGLFFHWSFHMIQMWLQVWFRSSKWISTAAGISKILCTGANMSEVASATRTYVRM